MRSRWLVCRLNIFILIILIQQPEPSGSKAGESWVKSGFGKFCRQSISLKFCGVLLRSVYLRQGNRLVGKNIKRETPVFFEYVSAKKCILTAEFQNSCSHCTIRRRCRHSLTSLQDHVLLSSVRAPRSWDLSGTLREYHLKRVS
jgi:hypothetical protein